MSQAEKKDDIVLEPLMPKLPRWQPTSDANNIVIPGLDTSASVHDQIDQIEQLITLKLQDVDTNFVKIQQVLTTRILPAFKRFSVGTESVREAAKFWTSFYEQAAQVRIPTEDDFETVQDDEIVQQEDEASSIASSIPQDDIASLPDDSLISSDSSFAPAQGAISSTPAAGLRFHSSRARQDSFNEDTEADPSWNPLVESPLQHLDREMQSLTIDDERSLQLQGATYMGDVTAQPTPKPGDYKKDRGKKKHEEPLIRNVFRQQQHQAADESQFDQPSSSSILPTPHVRHLGVSPLRIKPKPKTPIVSKHENPYLPSDKNPAEWDGLVDLTTTSLGTPPRAGHQQSGKRQHPSSTSRSVAVAHNDDDDDEQQEEDEISDDSDLGLPTGMSPPVSLPFAPAPRSSISLGLLPKLGRTPRKEAIARIRQDVMHSANRQGGTADLPDSPREVFKGKGKEIASEKGTLDSQYAATLFRKYNNSGKGSREEQDTSRASSMSALPTPPSITARYGHAASGSAYGRTEDTMSSIGMNESMQSLMTRRYDLGAGTYDDLNGTVKTLPKTSPGIEELRKRYPGLSDETITPLPHSDDEDEDDMDDDLEAMRLGVFSAHTGAKQVQQQERQHHHEADDSFGSSNASTDSMDDSFGDEQGHDVGQHLDNPAEGDEGGDGFEDDSFDDDSPYKPRFRRDDEPTETLFGVTPAHRLQRERERERQAQALDGQGRLRMMGEELMQQDTIGIGAQLARAGRIEESPTPWSGGTAAGRR